MIQRIIGSQDRYALKPRVTGEFEPQRVTCYTLALLLTRQILLSRVIYNSWPVQGKRVKDSGLKYSCVLLCEVALAVWSVMIFHISLFGSCAVSWVVVNVSLVVCSSKSPLADSPPICGFVFSVQLDEEGRSPGICMFIQVGIVLCSLVQVCYVFSNTQWLREESISLFDYLLFSC